MNTNTLSLRTNYVYAPYVARTPEDTAWIAAALHAVYEHDARFEIAEGFARWFSTVGRLTYGSDLVSAWNHWRANDVES